MDQNQLLAFERIAREGSFSRAARALAISQATISGRIQALEAVVGAPLFLRGGRRVTLTPAGEAFLPYARRALALLAEGVESARAGQSEQQGRVAVGAIDSLSETLLVPVVARFRAEHPAVVVSVRSGHTPQIVQELADGIVRLGLVTWSYLTGAVKLEVLARLREPLVAVAAPSHPLARRATLSVEELIAGAEPYHETAWGTPADARIAGAAQRRFADHELPHGLMRALLLRGAGAAWMPRSLVAPELASGTLVALPIEPVPGLVREVALVRDASGEPLPPAAASFVRTIEEEARRMGLG